MLSDRRNPLDLEKQKIADRLADLERTVGRALNKIYGDPDSNPPVMSLETRLKELEKIENSREKNKQTLIKTALGSVTIAVGAIVLWIFTVLRDAFIGHK